MQMLYDVMVSVLGQPQNEMQQNLAYAFAGITLILAMYALIKLAQYFTRVGR